MTRRRGLAVTASRAVLRFVLRLGAAAAAAGLLLAALPVSVVAVTALAVAWLRGWPPRRLYAGALWCGPMVAAWLAATAVEGTGRWRVAQAPYRAWLGMWHLGAAGSLPAAAAVIAPAAIPLGLVAGALAWSYRIRSLATGAGGLSPDAAVSFDLRRWRHQVTSAQASIAAPGSVPLTTRDGSLVAGAVIRTVGHPVRLVARLPYQRNARAPGSDRHQRDGQDHAAAAVVGRFHGDRAAAARSRAGPAAAAGGAGLQRRRGRPPNR